MKIKIYRRSIEREYGKENVDAAGDDLIYCLRQAEDYSGQIGCDFEDECTHDNPCYHTLNLIILRASDSQFTDIVERVKELKLELEPVDPT